MKLVFFGTPQFAVPSLEKLLAHPEMEVVAVVTQPDKRRGRGGKTSPSPVKAIAINAGLPVWQPRRVKKDADTLDQLRSAGADAFVVVAYGQILSPEILEMPRLGCVNAHGSLLPRYRGAAPIQWCLYHGETETGITTMLMDAGMDTGPMLLKNYTPIGLLENASDLAGRLACRAGDLLQETLPRLADSTVEPTPQDDGEATYAPLLGGDDYQLDWSKPAIALHNQIRGFYPNCVTTFRGEPMKVGATVPLGSESESQLPPEFAPLLSLAPKSGQVGEIVAIAKRFGPVVQTGDGYLLLSQVKLPGKRAQSGWDFVNGTRVAPGEQIG
ncbi:methionyl-tRNA formyltransferase [Lyngbya sp. CCY1209]|uniref:methionyl-tRNA formyltransferase n=1 Tax=Lyngbya sp. CCY1209 TaxID=2886103 RepID=UPI002D20C6E4|nr:methionyl-tRNA formyltransferase [Lyngbya sp. CCY1209]MEB3887310.1 methionyl-tRNA formyltransferase [Lyngbya sp. CCY1209]